MRNETQASGRLICFEGIDGAGKDTQVGLLAAELIRVGLDVEVFRFPDYSGPLGDTLKSALCDPAFDPYALQLLFSAERFRQSGDLRQALAKNHVVLTSRYKVSSYVYAVARGLPRSWAEMLESPLLEPALTILLDIDVPTSRDRTGGKDVLEGDLLLMNRCRTEYLGFASNREGWVIVDGRPASLLVASDVRRVVRNFLNL